MTNANVPTLPALIVQHRDELLAICRRYSVSRLELFGSATSDQFDPATSDLDFLVDFDMTAPVGSWLSVYFEFRDSLEMLFGQPVDLVSLSAVENPHVRTSIQETRVLLYAA